MKTLPRSLHLLKFVIHKKLIINHWSEIAMENEIKKVSKYLRIPAGKLSYTENNIIQMKAGAHNIVGFSSIINHIHNACGKENETPETFFLVKQYFDFANLFIRSTSKRDKCESSRVSSANSDYYIS